MTREGISMRHTALLSAACLAALPLTGLAAQSSFEGVITMTMKGTESHVYVKGSRMRIENGDRILIRGQDGKTLAIRSAARQYLVLGTMGKPSSTSFEATGRGETVAGYPCKYYKVVESNAGKREDREGCVSTALGFVILGPGGTPLTDEAMLRGQFSSGFMLLKVVDKKGVASLEVTKVDRRAVSDAMFAPPQGFTEIKLPGMGAPPRP
jgi:Domain of unknown function (DUF4412)